MTETLKLSDLKVGDKVIRYNRFNQSIRTIDAITPAGNIKIGTIVYRPDGTMRTKDSYFSLHIGLFDADAWQEYVVKSKQEERRRIVASFDWKSATLEQIEAAYAIIKA